VVHRRLRRRGTGAGFPQTVPRQRGLALLLCAELWWYGGRFVRTEPALSFASTFYPRTKLIQILEQRVLQGGRVVYTDDLLSFVFDQNQPEISCERTMIRDIRNYAVTIRLCPLLRRVFQSLAFAAARLALRRSGRATASRAASRHAAA